MNWRCLHFARVKLLWERATGAERKMDCSRRKTSRRRSLHASCGGRQRDTFPAATARRLIRILEHEGRRKTIRLDIHPRSQKVKHSLGVDDYASTCLLHDLVARLRLGELHPVAHPRASALLDADPQASRWALHFSKEAANSIDSGVAQINDRGCGEVHSLSPWWRRGASAMPFPSPYRVADIQFVGCAEGGRPAGAACGGRQRLKSRRASQLLFIYCTGISQSRGRFGGRGWSGKPIRESTQYGTTTHLFGLQRHRAPAASCARRDICGNGGARKPFFDPRGRPRCTNVGGGGACAACGGD